MAEQPKPKPFDWDHASPARIRQYAQSLEREVIALRRDLDIHVSICAETELFRRRYKAQGEALTRAMAALHASEAEFDEDFIMGELRDGKPRVEPKAPEAPPASRPSKKRTAKSKKVFGRGGKK